MKHIENKKMTSKEFLDYCVPHGGNWSAMIMSGIRNCADEYVEWKRLFYEMPDKDYSIMELMKLTSAYVDLNSETTEISEI